MLESRRALTFNYRTPEEGFWNSTSLINSTFFLNSGVLVYPGGYSIPEGNGLSAGLLGLQF